MVHICTYISLAIFHDSRSHGAPAGTVPFCVSLCSDICRFNFCLYSFWNCHSFFSPLLQRHERPFNAHLDALALPIRRVYVCVCVLPYIDANNVLITRLTPTHCQRNADAVALGCHRRWTKQDNQRVVNCELWTASCELWIANCELYKLWIQIEEVSCSGTMWNHWQQSQCAISACCCCCNSRSSQMTKHTCPCHGGCTHTHTYMQSKRHSSHLLWARCA